jgi:hypothetical protein
MADNELNYHDNVFEIGARIAQFAAHRQKFGLIAKQVSAIRPRGSAPRFIQGRGQLKDDEFHGA